MRPEGVMTPVAEEETASVQLKVLAIGLAGHLEKDLANQ